MTSYFVPVGKNGIPLIVNTEGAGPGSPGANDLLLEHRASRPLVILMEKRGSVRPAPLPEGPVELSGQDRLHVILDMIRSVDTLTLAGQRHAIVRIVDLLDEEIVRRARAAGDSVMEAIVLLLPRLRCEAERLLPDVPAFVGQAEILIDAIEEA